MCINRLLLSKTYEEMCGVLASGEAEVLPIYPAIFQRIQKLDLHITWMSKLGRSIYCSLYSCALSRNDNASYFSGLIFLEHPRTTYLKWTGSIPSPFERLYQIRRKHSRSIAIIKNMMPSHFLLVVSRLNYYMVLSLTQT